MRGPVRLVHFQVESFCDRIPTSVDTPQPCPDPLLHRCIDTVGYNERWFSNDMKDTEALLFAANVQGIGSIKIFLAPERERERERAIGISVNRTGPESDTACEAGTPHLSAGSTCWTMLDTSPSPGAIFDKKWGQKGPHDCKRA